MSEVSASIQTGDGHAIVWYDTGQSLLEAEIAAIASAQKAVQFERYIFRASLIGDRFRDAFVEAARRGVVVTLLLDYVGCFGLPAGYFNELTAAGGRVVWFNPVRWRLWTFRDHRKLLVVDESQAFVGGCNVAVEYDGDGVNTGWRDGGVAIEGPAVAVLVKAFESQLAKAGNQIWRARKLGQNGWVQAGDDVAVLLMRPGLHQGVLQMALKRDLAHAQDVTMTMAYFLPKGRFKRMLLRAAKVARSFRLLLPGKTDVPLMQVATRALYNSFQRRGAEIHEYQPQVLHAKVIVVDDFVYVGSSNLDPRSLSINFEVMLRIRSTDLARQAKASFQKDLEHSKTMARLSWRRPNNWWIQVKEKIARFVFAQLDLGISQLLVQKIERRGSSKKSQASSRTRKPRPEKQNYYAQPGSRSR